MTRNHTLPGAQPEVCEPVAANLPTPVPCVKPPISVDRERLEALRSELDEESNHWPAYMAATIHEDYWQLMKDFGFH